jgi:general secretion pathway protein A
VVLIIDEAQNLSSDALEQIRLLTNLETPTQKLLQIILLGQPELRELLARTELRQLAQRITARYHLTPLSADETDAYLRHRLAVAGCARFPFTKLAVKRLHEHAGGVPRLINVIADRALMAGYAQNLQQIGERAVDLAASEAMASPIRRLKLPSVSVWVALLLGAALMAMWQWPRDSKEPHDESMPESDQAEPEQPDEPDPADELVTLSGLRDHMSDAGSSSVTAWNQLLSLWTLRAEDVDVRTAQRCPAVLAPGIFCLRSSGSLSKLATLERPVVMRLSSEGRDAWAVLLGLSSTRARLSVDGETFNVTRRTLERAWLGEYFALWRAPEYMAGVLRRGDSGPPVEWLRSVLPARDRSPPAEGPALFDESMENAVRRVQASHGLVPDGVVGPETLFAMVSRERVGPRLRKQL